MITKEVRKAMENAVPLSIHLQAGGGGLNIFGKVDNMTSE